MWLRCVTSLLAIAGIGATVSTLACGEEEGLVWRRVPLNSPVAVLSPDSVLAGSTIELEVFGWFGPCSRDVRAVVRETDSGFYIVSASVEVSDCGALAPVRVAPYAVEMRDVPLGPFQVQVSGSPGLSLELCGVEVPPSSEALHIRVVNSVREPVVGESVFVQVTATHDQIHLPPTSVSGETLLQGLCALPGEQYTLSLRDTTGSLVFDLDWYKPTDCTLPYQFVVGL
jgi:hypothetical protein